MKELERAQKGRTVKGKKEHIKGFLFTNLYSSEIMPYEEEIKK
jgi:hypothetical protein